MRPRQLALVPALAAIAACSDSATEPLNRLAPTAEARGGTDDTEIIYGLTSDNRLVTINTTKPNQTTSDVAVTGLAAGETVLAIDFRPSDLNANGINDVGKLYGVTSANRIYIINPETGAASSPVTLSVSLTSSDIGAGFNPVPDRLRIHTASNQNLRVNVDNGAVSVDGVLAYGTGDANFGINPAIVATGYTNNDNDPATGTTLYGLDAETDALITFPTATGGPNGGVMSTVGFLGIDIAAATGFDISLASNVAYAAIATSPSGKSTLYSIDLATGSAIRLGLLAQTKSALLSIAVRP